MKTTKHLCRQLIDAIVQPLGYTVSGNHIFRHEDAAHIARGGFRWAVIEQPDWHDAKVVRAAELLARTY